MTCTQVKFLLSMNIVCKNIDLKTPVTTFSFANAHFHFHFSCVYALIRSSSHVWASLLYTASVQTFWVRVKRVYVKLELVRVESVVFLFANLTCENLNPLSTRIYFNLSLRMGLELDLSFFVATNHAHTQTRSRSNTEVKLIVVTLLQKLQFTPREVI
jgi:hypothetical protein